ncbi:uncharacterized protein LOC143073674 [Mytilus galloprovincialis]|uniref:uncharacterized protein LOC143073674 n=1 Tax=Mytilus galloprovincialis TaxID=29158 RepID=UPI003F7B9BBF
MEVHEQRKLDVAKPASTDILSLNNKIIMMRQAVKKAKGQTVQKIIRRVKSLRNKKGTEEEKNKDKRKIERQLEVMYAIKDLKLDKVSKFAIGYDSVLQEITEKPDASAEMIALARLSEHAALKEEVDKFRKDHDDWKSLSEFLLNHIPRRFNKNKYKEIKSKMMTNVNAGNVLVKAYLENKVGKNSELTIEDNSGVLDNASDTDLVNKSTDIEKVSQGQTPQVKDESQQELSEVLEEISCKSTNEREESQKSTEIIRVSPQKTSKVNIEKSPKKFTKVLEEKTHKLTIDKEKSDKSEKQTYEEEDSNSNGDNDSLIESENNEISDDQSNAESESRVEESDNDESESRVEGSDNDESEISEEDSDDNEQDESENEDHTKIKGEMVVKKLNMNDLVNSKDEDIPDFLVANSQEENISKVRKSKDSFFERGDTDSDDEDSDRNLSSTHGDSESDDMGEDEKREASRQAISSSFLGALNEVKSKHRPYDESEGQGYGGRWGHFDRRNDSRGRGGFDRRNDSRGRGGFDRRNDSRGRGYFDRRNDSRGRGHFDRRDDSRGRGQNRGFGNSDRFDNYRGRGGQGRFERGGRGNFRGQQNGPRDFQRSDNRGSSYRQNQSSRNMNSYADNKGSSTKTEEKLHPSWEASKKRKEHSTIQAFQGKKIKFDD